MLPARTAGPAPAVRPSVKAPPQPSTSAPKTASTSAPTLLVLEFRTFLTALNAILVLGLGAMGASWAIKSYNTGNDIAASADALTTAANAQAMAANQLALAGLCLNSAVSNVQRSPLVIVLRLTIA